MRRNIGAGRRFHQVFRQFFSPAYEQCYSRENSRRNAMPGMGELIIILLIDLVVFGANKLPGIGDALGRSIKNFKKASNVDGDDDVKDAKAVKAVAAGGAKAQLDEGDSDDGEWEEVVVRRKKKKEA